MIASLEPQHKIGRGEAKLRGSEWRSVGRAVGFTLLGLTLLLLAIALLGEIFSQQALAGDILTLALPAFLAGMFSSLSPCSLPILMGYFSVTIQERPERVGMVSIAFLGGVATTMTVLGASFTALGSLAVEQQTTLTAVGGVLVIGFGVMSLLGKGFGGLRVFNRPAATVGGAYGYGLIFALGWTTCVGPILGSILTMLLTEGSSVGGALSIAAGGGLVLVYVVGLGLPIFMIVSAIAAAGPQNRVSRILKGRGWEVRIAGRSLYLHTTQIASGVMLIGLGILLLTGQMTAMSEQLVGSSFSQQVVRLEGWLNDLIH